MATIEIRWQAIDVKPLLGLGSLVLATMAASCGSSGSEESGYEVVDSAGVQIVESAAPVWDDGSVRIEPEPFVRIGREEAGPYQFAFIAAAALLDGGHIAVGDAGMQEVRIFDPSGEHVTTFGGAGDGPGEFRGLALLFDYPGDSVAAFDGRHYRTTIFSIASGESRTIKNQVEGNYTAFGRVGSGPLLLYSAGRSFRPDLAPGLQWVETDIVAMGPDDASTRTIAKLPDRWRRVRSDGNAPMPQPLMYAVQAVTDDGFYWATPDRYEIGFYDVEGDLRRIVRRPVERRAVEPSMIEEFIENQLERVRRYEGEEAVPGQRARYEREEYGDHLPLFQAAFVDTQGRLWVGSSEWPVNRPSRVWSVFSPDGRWLGDLEAPDGVSVVDADEDTVLGLWQDGLDVPHVQLHHLVTERSAF